MYETHGPMIPFEQRTRMRMVAGMRRAERRQREAIVVALAEADGSATLVALAYALDLNPGLLRMRVQDLVEHGAIEDTAE